MQPFLRLLFFARGGNQSGRPTHIKPGQDIVAQTTWTKEDSPYIVKARINVNAKLTINPGVVVKFWTGPV